MPRRQVLQGVIVREDGTRMSVSVLDGLLPEDVLVLGMKTEGYRLLTGRDEWKAASKEIKDHLVRFDRLQEG